MPDLASARELAVRMRDIGVRAGRPTVCELTAMDSPLGAAVGNALEVAESCEMLAGGGPDDFRELVLGSAARMAVLSDLGRRSRGRPPPRRGCDRLRRGAARARAAAWRRRAATRGSRSGRGTCSRRRRSSHAVPAPRAGAVARCGALAIGRAAMRLGAGRERKEDPIDHAVGIVVHAKPGDRGRGGRAARARPRPRRGRRRAGRCRGARRLRARRRPRGAAAAVARDDRLMPELPEVETVRRRLVPHLTGRTLAEVEIFDHRLTDPEPPSAVAARLSGARIDGARPARQVPADRAGRRRGAGRCTCA